MNTKTNPTKINQSITYRIFKYDPSTDERPYMQTWFMQPAQQSAMILDELFRIKNNKDESLAFRRSCREGICGSCAMNINGKNGLACTYKVTDVLQEFSLRPFNEIRIFPLPHMPIIKDLVVCMKHFYLQYKSIDPFLKEKSIDFRNFKSSIPFSVIKRKPRKENIQSKSNRLLIDGLYECILCACCSTSCPSYWWNRDKYLGPAILLQAYRWIIDSRDQALQARLDYLDDIYKLQRCHTILNCIKCCPKNLSPAAAISNIKSLLTLR